MSLMILSSRSFSAELYEVKLPLYKKTINDLIDTVHDLQAENKLKDNQIIELQKSYDKLVVKAKEGPGFDVETATIFGLVGVILGFFGAKVIR